MSAGQQVDKSAGRQYNLQIRQTHHKKLLNDLDTHYDTYYEVISIQFVVLRLKSIPFKLINHTIFEKATRIT